ncbi:MAG: hypothetical protein DRQ08_09105 [Candidatus Latescibacterota bacterium]|nr:MAG: hypothetical protein DRQ08_09105 [Candidatus Latescibacterota bacterium]
MLTDVTLRRPWHKRPKGGDMSERYHLHVIFGTHWDREWLYSFQETRMKLVELMERLFEIFEKHPEYKYHLDGQSILLEDYLEIRPEDAQRIKKYVEEGRLFIGPWYVLPDMFSVGGESIVRNILFGIKLCERFGGAMKVGYSPTGWGQPSQMPQIWRGFGIDSASCYRGIATHVVPAEFLWEAPDGSTVWGFRFGTHPRYGFGIYVYRQVVLGRKIYRSEEDRDTNVPWERMGFPFHTCDEGSWKSDYFELGPEVKYDKSKIAETLKLFLEEQLKSATTPHINCLHAFDSALPNPYELQLVLDAAKETEYDIFVSTLPDYVEAVKASLKEPKKVVGELRYPVKDGMFTQTFGSMVSSGVPVKKKNFLVEWRLQKWAEPFATIAWVLGKEYPERFLEKAWKFLFQAHPHDTIGGSATNRVFLDTMYRLNQCEDIAENVLRESLKHIVLNIDNPDLEGKEAALVVFNNLPFPRSELVSVVMAFDRNPDFWDVRIADSRGRDAEHALEYVDEEDIPLYHPLDRLLTFPATRAKIHFLAEVPAFGYKTFKVTPYTFKELGYSFRPVRGERREFRSLVTGTNTMENEHLKVEINPDGTFDLTDKENGITYRGMHYFEDSGECGNAWIHAEPAFDMTITSLGSPARIAKVVDTPLKASFKVELVMRLPERYDPFLERRVEHEREFPITSIITLTKNSRRVEVQTIIDNTVKDHRFRVVFPTHLKAAVSHAESIFDVVERPIKLPECKDWVEPQPMTNPQVSFVDLSDGEVGVAIINEGLKEYEVTDTPERAIALTLLRCFEMKGFSRVDRKDPDPEPNHRQNLGVHRYRYAIYPHRGDWREGEVFKEAYSHNSPLRAVQCGGRKGTLPKECSFMEISPAELVVAAVKRGEDGEGVVVRFFNPTEEAISGRIRFFKPLKEALLTNLLEEPIGRLELEDEYTAIVEVPKKKIVTVKLVVR